MNVRLGVVARNRPAALLRCLQSAYCNAGSSITLTAYVLFDGDAETPYAIPRYRWANYIIQPLRMYYVSCANRLVRDYLLAPPAPDFFVLTDDDTEFVGEGWAETAIQHHQQDFPDRIGVVELVDVNECCHFLTTPETVEWLGGELYDSRYRQFFHDTVLMERLRDADKLSACAKSANRGKLLLHHRDWQGGAYSSLALLREEDYDTFLRHGNGEQLKHSRTDPRRRDA